MERRIVNGIDDVHVSDEVVTERKRGVFIRTGICSECGKKVAQQGAGRTMRYCSNACRMRAYRQRKGKASPVKNVTRDEKSRVREMESAIEVLEAENRQLQNQVFDRDTGLGVVNKQLREVIETKDVEFRALRREWYRQNVTLETLRKEVAENSVTIEALRNKPADENVTRNEMEVVRLFGRSGGQCQASTKGGERCRCRTPGSLRIVTTETKCLGRVAMFVCPTHHRKFEKVGCIQPHLSIT